MLYYISWIAFARVVLTAAAIYYLLVGSLYYRKEIGAILRRSRSTISIILASVFIHYTLYAQTADGNNGISQANTLVRSYFDTGTQLMYAVGAIIGLIGAIRVYKLWTTGHREDVGQAAAGWFGSCIFLVIVATVIKSFFGL